MPDNKSIQNWLADNKITEIECIISDLTGIARGKIMPANKFSEGTITRIPESVLMLTVTGDYTNDYSMIDDAEIDIYLRPDPDAVRTLPWALEPTAQIIHDCYGADGELVDMAPRTHA